MSNVMIILDVLVVTGLIVSAILASQLENLLSAVIALSVTGIFAAAAFLIMHAPDVAISGGCRRGAQPADLHRHPEKDQRQGRGRVMKKFLTYVCLGVLLVAMLAGALGMAKMPRTYAGQNAAVSVYDLQQNPESYNDSIADGAAAAIVQQNLSETHSVNDVTSIVFDFRGYDTMGEAFILITAVAGAVVILYTKKKEGKSDE